MSFPRAYDDLGKVTLTEDFPYSQVDSDLAGRVMDMSPEEAACECQRQIWQWVYQPPCKDLDGYLCRCIIACWIFVPQLRSYTMTKLARRFAKRKQSLGRWVSDFKRTFPELSKHLEHLRR